MGAPKQKWTPEEEAALRAGVSKHGPGKWRTILKDPEFSGVLCLRSNVDLKDKWRNMSVMANGLGSRERSRLALKRMPSVHRQGESPVSTVSGTTQSDDDTLDPRALTTSSGSPQIGGSKRSIIRLDNLIMEAISNLKEPSGSHKTTIASYIEDEYWAPPNFKRLLSSKLKYLTATGKLVKIKRKFRIASASALSDKKRKPSVSSVPMLGLPLEGRQAFSPIIDRDDTAVITISDIDVELARIRNMTQQEAAAAAAQAVAEAEAAIADAEEAAREADVAEAEAEAAMAFAEAANKTLNGKGATRMMLRA